ncbi:heme lyase NrfEFG subunit NrfG [Candidatus Symbiopectobacterium sp. NZEC127]|uniref:heme lyase NrfEFG subunit NrfG n=1 Tax=Candidatus Symbiopectobacterium sp. NZEC127 TaxID=2820472 RepID=UPI002226014C|nr:heme lyase NrfEFG subunit NrfG [Candidatus Symbiopectobacterium sp. NZEC127]MCW2484371.1 heme lyase NrfEFG subunit NrfG [Candidatus Symbiopectobacterium sp. NZEC127]
MIVTAATVLVVIVGGLLWPLIPVKKTKEDNRLSGLTLHLWQWQCRQAKTQLSARDAQALRDELEKDLPVAERAAAAQRTMPLLPLVIAVAVIVVSGFTGYSLSHRGEALVAERQRLADPLRGFSDAQQQEKQLATLQRAIRATPDNSVLWAELGEYYLYRNAYDNAQRAYRRAMALKGENAELYSALATVLYYQSGQIMTPATREMIDNALALDANEVTALMLLASDAFLRADYAAAVTLWQRLLDGYSPRINRVQLIEAINTAKLLQQSQQ